MQSIVRTLATTFMALTLSPLSVAQNDTPQFDIDRFIVKGNTLLKAGEIEETLLPFTGNQGDFSDIQDATEALRQRYRSSGFNAVWVIAPEQELDNGVVLLQVIEAQLGTITINGNRSHDDANIRASLPALTENALPRAEDISLNIQLANQNPSKQVDVVLRPGATQGVVNATIDVIDERTFKGFVTLDSTGNAQTGTYRLGVGARYANLFNRDHILTLSYTASPNSNEKTSLYSASYRLPLYSLGDSIDFIAAYSDVSVGTVQTVAGGLDFAGQGRVYNIRYNQLLARRGEYSHQLVYGVDYRSFENQCTLGTFGEAGCGPAALDVTVSPVSLTYSGNWSKPDSVSNFHFVLSRNIERGQNGHELDFNGVRPSPNGGIGAPSRYKILRLGGSIVKAFDSNWQVRMALSSQYTHDALISGEQLGFTGATSVRGFLEREIVRDTGNIVNMELYSPNFAGLFLPGENNVRGLLFYDFARGNNNPLDGELNGKVSVASVGVGIRWNFARNFNLRFDMARIVDGDRSSRSGDMRGHISIFLSL